MSHSVQFNWSFCLHSLSRGYNRKENVCCVLCNLLKHTDVERLQISPAIFVQLQNCKITSAKWFCSFLNIYWGFLFLLYWKIEILKSIYIYICIKSKTLESLWTVLDKWYERNHADKLWVHNSPSKVFLPAATLGSRPRSCLVTVLVPETNQLHNWFHQD